MPTDEILTLEIEPPYIGSAVSPTVDIDETTDDITVTITDFRGEHSYTVEKTDQAIEDAEQAAQNANDTAQTVAQGWANRQNEINVTMNSMRTLMTNSANAESQRVIAENARVAAENERVHEWDELSTDVTAATSAANEAAGQANIAAQGAIGAANAANYATTRANNTITGITQNANQIFAQAGQATIDANAAAQSATDAATLATNKAGLANTAAQNADTATTAANAAATTATTAAEQADAAREAIQSDLAAKADADGYYQLLTAGLADTVAGGSSEVVQFAQRTSDRDGMASIQSIHGNTVAENGELVSVNIDGIQSAGTTRTIPASTYFPNGMNGIGNSYDELTPTKATLRFRVTDGGGFNPIAHTTAHIFYIAPSSTPKKAGTTNFAAEGYEVVNVYAANLANMQATGSGTNNRMYFRNDNCSTSAEMKSAMEGVTLIYELATPVETIIDPPLNMTYPVESGGTESIVIPTGEQSAPPTMAIAYGYDADGVRDISQAIIATIEGNTASTNYAIGGYFVHGGMLYKATSAIVTGETITPGTNCVATTVMTEIVRLTA